MFWLCSFVLDYIHFQEVICGLWNFKPSALNSALVSSQDNTFPATESMTAIDKKTSIVNIYTYIRCENFYTEKTKKIIHS